MSQRLICTFVLGLFIPALAAGAQTVRLAGASYSAPGQDATARWAPACPSDCRAYDTNGGYPVIIVFAPVSGNADAAFTAMNTALQSARGEAADLLQREDAGEGSARSSVIGVNIRGGLTNRGEDELGAVVALEQNGKTILLALVDPAPEGLAAGGARLQGLLQSVAFDPPTPVKAVPPAPAQSPATLVAALAAVPKSSRPEFIEFYSTHSGMSFSTAKRMFFPTGYMTTCTDWDPAVLSPTPASLGKAMPDCDLYRWRRADGRVEFEYSPGDWDEVTSDDPTILKLPPGKTFDLAWGNVRSFGFNTGAAGSGAVQTGTMSGDELQMTSAGEIAVGSWTTTNISGAGIGGGSSSETGPVRGRYQIDGNIIAISDASGRISRGFIIAVGSGGKVSGLYLNGTHYYDRSE
jgi:hypothetical protein